MSQHLEHQHHRSPRTGRFETRWTEDGTGSAAKAAITVATPTKEDALEYMTTIELDRPSLRHTAAVDKRSLSIPTEMLPHLIRVLTEHYVQSEAHQEQVASDAEAAEALRRSS